MGFGNAYAHKAEVIGDYKIEIGWDEEPPIQGIGNLIELVVTHATESDKQKAAAEDSDKNMTHGDHNAMISEDDEDSQGSTDNSETTHDERKPMSEHNGTEASHMEDEHDATEEHDHDGGISGLANTIQIAVTLDEKTSTLILSETAIDGIYQGKFTPSSPGYPVVHLSGMIHDTKVDLDMHPEEVESLNTLSPLKQIEHGVEPSNVQCKTGLELFMRVHEDSAICASSDLGERLMALGVVDYF